MEPPDGTKFSSDPHPTFHPYFHAVGKVSIVWAEFEFAINDTIWEFANVSRSAGTCMTAQLIGPAPRFRCLVSLMHMHGVSQELINACNSISGRAEALGRQRNRYLHDPIVLNTEDGTIARMETTADRKLRHEFVRVEAGALSKLAAEIDDLSKEFDDLIIRILDETQPWPREAFSRSRGIQRHRLRTKKLLKEAKTRRNLQGSSRGRAGFSAPMREVSTMATGPLRGRSVARMSGQ